jgi:glycosyltransferase involved in cell wall biosynthesis
VEYLVVDGGSTDGTLQIINNYAEHITWWVSEPDEGIYDAMNKGWAAAADDSYILFLGAGDKIISLPDICQYDLDQAIYGAVRMGENRIFKPRADYHLNLYNSIHHQALLVCKDLHPEPPFNCQYRRYADFDFNQRLKRSKASFVYAPDFISYAHPGGVSDQPSFTESVKVIISNYGYFWAVMAIASYCIMKIFPLMKRLRPVQEI